MYQIFFNSSISYLLQVIPFALLAGVILVKRAY